MAHAAEVFQTSLIGFQQKQTEIVYENFRKIHKPYEFNVRLVLLYQLEEWP